MSASLSAVKKAKGYLVELGDQVVRGRVLVVRWPEGLAVPLRSCDHAKQAMSGVQQRFMMDSLGRRYH